MSRFIEEERQHQAEFKARSTYFSTAARADGFYGKRWRSYCLPAERAEQNLFDEVRSPALNYFAQQEIKWHDPTNGGPSNHMCDSQVSCVNFLFPFADKPRALVELLQPLFPMIRHMLSMEEEFPNQFVSFEWIGKRNYLIEVCLSGKRSRGANCTSADAAVMFEHQDGKRQIVLIEWKYTEHLRRCYAEGPSGVRRLRIYKPLYDAPNCPLNKSLLNDLSDLFYDPFYQFMRQQFLAHLMEHNHELGADIVSVLHIAPAQNREFAKLTLPVLRRHGIAAPPTEIWKTLWRTPGGMPARFMSIGTEELFGCLPIDRLPELKTWWDYIHGRYVWL